MADSSSIEGEVGFAIQTAKGNPATTFDMVYLTRFRWGPDVIQDEEGEPEIGGDMDVSPAERYGHRGITFEGEARFRPGHLGRVLRLFGMQCQDGGFVLWDGVNETISVTDDGGGPVTVDLISGTGASAEEGVVYTAAEMCTHIKAALDGDTTLSQTYTVTYTDNKFTIAHAGATLSLHWTTTPMIANLLGYDHSADDTGATSYVADEARVVDGRWSFRDGVNDVIRVTDDGGGPVDVDILAGDEAILSKRVPYSAWVVCAGLKAVLDGDTTLTQTYVVTYDADTNKFTITHGGSTLSLHWTHANSNMQESLGFDDTADDTGSTSYTGDNAILPAKRHYFSVYPTQSSFPWGSILDKMNQDAELDSVIADARVARVRIDARDEDVLRMTFSGRGLDVTDAAGSEVENAEEDNIATPNTKAGSLTFGTTTDYEMSDLGLEFSWTETPKPRLCQSGPGTILAGRRVGRGESTIWLGTEADGAVFRATYYGSTTGTGPSTTIVQRPLDVRFDSGQAITGPVGVTEYYGVRFESDECRMLAYPVEKSGDSPEAATLTFQVAKQTDVWGITLINDEDFDAYEA